MTALCGGGTSGPKSGTAAVVAVTSGFIALALDEAGIGWVKALIPLMTLPEIALSSFCGTDPPAAPTFTQPEADALLNLTLDANFVSGLAKLPALIQNLYWNAFCQCNTGVYTPPSWPAQPAGSVTVVPPTPQSGQPCASNTGSQITNTSNQAFAGRGGCTVPNTGGVTTARITVTQSIAVAPGLAMTYTVEDENGGGIIATYAGVVVPAGTASYSWSYTPSYSTTFVNVNTQAAVGTGQETNQILVELFCNGTQPGQQQPCCPPDIATAATLQTILDLVRSMQRNYAPFSYVLAAAVPGLTGTGSVSVQRSIGVKVVITAYPGSDQVLAGNPSYIKNLGWMSVADADGMIQEIRIARTAFTWFPELMPLANAVNYFLEPGVTATITAILPES